MEKFTEVLKSVTTFFNVYLTVIVVGLALLLSPPIKDYHEAIAELKRLRDITPEKYRAYVYWLSANDARFCPPGFKTYPGDTTTIKDFIENYTHYNESGSSVHIIPNSPTNIPNWKIYPIIEDYRPIPIDSSLSSWDNWYYSKQEATCYLPNWDSGLIHRSLPAFANLNLFIRGFTLMERPTGTTGDYIFRIYFDSIPYNIAPNSYYANGVPREKHCCEQYDTIEVRYEQFIDDHPILQIYLLKKGLIGIPNSGINYWIHRDFRDSLLVQTTSGERFLPALHDIWSEISSKTVYEALSYLETKKIESRKITLVGIDFSFSFVVTIFPLAFFLINMFIFLHLKYLNDNIKQQNERLVFPWIGLYKFGAARIVAFLIFILSPAIICILLIQRFGAIVNVGIMLLLFSYVLIALIITIGFLILHQNKKLRIAQTKVNS